MSPSEFDSIAGLESRGFLFGPAMAAHLGKGFIAVRKAGKLPPETIGESYDLEYGTASVEIETDAVQAGKRVLIVDDLIATGGTAKAATDLIEKAGGHVVGFSFVMRLDGLDGLEAVRRQAQQLADRDARPEISVSPNVQSVFKVRHVLCTVASQYIVREGSHHGSIRIPGASAA